jgi:hypothetical protein
MWSSEIKREARAVLDHIIDCTLTCQEAIFSDKITNVPTFISRFETAFDFENLTSEWLVTKLLEKIKQKLQPQDNFLDLTYKAPKTQKRPEWTLELLMHDFKLQLKYLKHDIDNIYNQQTPHFKSIVEPQNRLIPLYVTFLTN